MSATHRILVAGKPVGLARVNAKGVSVHLFAAQPGLSEWAEFVLACGIDCDEVRKGDWSVTANPVTGWLRPVGGAHCAPCDRHNPDLEAIFAEPLSPPPPPAANLRHNPDLDAVFGV